MGAPRPGSSRGVLRWVQKSRELLRALWLASSRQRYHRCVGLTLCIQPGIDISRPKAKQLAELDGVGKVPASGMAVVDGLLGQPKIGCERFGREELLHGSRYWVRSHTTAFSICARYPRLLP